MTIRTAKALSWPFAWGNSDDWHTVVDRPESEVQAAFDALERSRQTCEWYQFISVDGKTVNSTYAHPLALHSVYGDSPDFCPSCGRKVVVNDN